MANSDILVNVHLQADKRSAEQAKKEISDVAKSIETNYGKVASHVSKNSTEARMVDDAKRRLRQYEDLSKKRTELLVDPYKVVMQKAHEAEQRLAEWSKKATYGNPYAPSHEKQYKADVKYYTDLAAAYAKAFYTVDKKTGEFRLKKRLGKDAQAIQDEIVNTSAYKSVELAMQKLMEQSEKAAEKLGYITTKEQEVADEAARLKEIADNAEISNQALVDLNDELKTLIEREKELKDAGVGILGYKEYDELEKRRKEIEAEIKKIQKENYSNTDREDASNNVSNTIAGLTKTGASMLKMSETLKNVSVASGETSGAIAALSSKLAAAAPYVSAIVLILGALKKVLNATLNATKTLGTIFVSSFTKAMSAISTAQKALWNFNKAVISGAVSGIRKLAEVFSGTGKSADTFSGKLRQSMKLLTKYLFGFRSFFYLYRRLRSQIVEGFNALVIKSPELNSAMSETMTLLYQLRVGFASAIEPIVSAVLPVLNTLITTLNEACNALANFFAVLTGKGTFLKATVQTQDYAESLDKTAKSAGGANKQLDKFTAGVDELNIIDPNSSSGGSGSSAGDTISTLETVEAVSSLAELLKEGWLIGDLTEFGQNIGNALASGLADIDWNNIQSKAEKFGKAFATLLNGVISAGADGKSLARLIGETITEAINTAIASLSSFLNNINATELGKAFIDFISGALTQIDWPQLKVTLNTFANRFVQFFEEIFSNPTTIGMVGLSLGEFFNTLMNNFILVVKNFPYEEAGNSIGLAIRMMFEHGITGQQLGEGICSLLNGVMKSGISLFKQFLASDTNIGAEFADAVNEISSKFNADDFKMLCEEIGLLFHDIISDAINGINITDLLELLGSVISGIWSGVKSYITGTTTQEITHGALAGNEVTVSLGESFVQIIQDSIKYINQHWDEIDATIQDIATTLGTEFGKLFDPNKDTWSDLGTLAGNAFNTVLSGIKTWLSEGDNLENLAESVKTFVKTALETVDTDKINEIITIACKLISDIINDQELWTTLSNTISQIDWIALATLAFEAFWLQFKLKLATIGPMIAGLFGGKLDPEDGIMLEDVGEQAADATVEGYSTGLTQSRYKASLSESANAVGANVVAGVVTGVNDNKDGAVSTLTAFGGELVGGVAKGAGCASPSKLTYDTALNIVQGLVNGIRDYKILALNAAAQFAKEVIMKITIGTSEDNVLNALRFKKIAETIMLGFKEGVEYFKAYAIDAIRICGEEIQKAFTDDGGAKAGTAGNQDGSFYGIGVNAIQGFINGTNSMKQALIDNARELARAYADAFSEDGLDEHSPSKLFAQYGEFVVDGFNEGIERKSYTSLDTLMNWANTLRMPSIVTGQAVPSGVSFASSRLSSLASNSAEGIINNSFANNTEVVSAIQTLTSVVEALNLNITLDGKKIENNNRNIAHRRGASIAVGGIINYA